MTARAAPMPGLLRSIEFDAFFVLALPVIAIASGLLVEARPELFWPVLSLDLWLLGYHHVISTYTRLAFDRASFNEHRALIVYLFPAVALAVTLIAVFAGLWVVVTIYVYWQWWHYTRQSEGISKAYAGRSRDRDLGNPLLRRAVFYAVPISGILAMSSRPSGLFLNMTFKQLPVPGFVVTASLVVTALLLAAWVVDQIRAYRAGKLAGPYVAYVVSHFAIYYVAYIYIKNFDHGWLVINIWHNAQYVFFVWLYNNRRFAGKPSPQHRLLSTISQNGRLWLYLATCLTLSTGVYFFIQSYVTAELQTRFALTAATVGIVVYQTINFHHYIVDSMIWKLRKAPIKKNLGLQ